MTLKGCLSVWLWSEKRTDDTKSIVKVENELTKSWQKKLKTTKDKQESSDLNKQTKTEQHDTHRILRVYDAPEEETDHVSPVALVVLIIWVQQEC